MEGRRRGGEGEGTIRGETKQTRAVRKRVLAVHKDTRAQGKCVSEGRGQNTPRGNGQESPSGKMRG